MDIMTKDSSLWDMTPCCSLFLKVLKDDNAFIFRGTYKEYFDCWTLEDESTVSLTMSAATHLTTQQLHTQLHSTYTPNYTAPTHQTTQQLHT